MYNLHDKEELIDDYQILFKAGSITYMRVFVDTPMVFLFKNLTISTYNLDDLPSSGVSMAEICSSYLDYSTFDYRPTELTIIHPFLPYIEENDHQK